ncbi:DUF6520 family protein [Gramella sp. AN32]|uniref:DUF6520 family protein n=1 Tax=Christiangramia antarctica TaxID=2058158 RepID=A0ABW5X8Q5_9FLAO|nr:DUF6520 family protein [Gramella sp. AN32]MCM4157614.1 hypothetical protein [Gramella sp. AN32]
MKKLFLIPFMALLVVLGMSFTNFGSETDKEPVNLASDYILVNGNWQPIAEQDCTGEKYHCQVKFSENGQKYNVYDEMNVNTLRLSPTPEARLITP